MAISEDYGYIIAKEYVARCTRMNLTHSSKYRIINGHINVFNDCIVACIHMSFDV